MPEVQESATEYTPGALPTLQMVPTAPGHPPLHHLQLSDTDATQGSEASSDTTIHTSGPSREAEASQRSQKCRPGARMPSSDASLSRLVMHPQGGLIYPYHKWELV